VQIAAVVGLPAVREVLTEALYRDVKKHAAFEARKVVKQDVHGDGLGGWIKNEGDADFGTQTSFV
jgi:hypothetical protein